MITTDSRYLSKKKHLEGNDHRILYGVCDPAFIWKHYFWGCEHQEEPESNKARGNAIDLTAQEFRIKKEKKRKRKLKPAKFQESKSLQNYEDMF